MNWQWLGRVSALTVLLCVFIRPMSMSTTTAEAATPPPVVDSWYAASNWYSTYNTGGGHSVWYNFGYNVKNGDPNSGDMVDLMMGHPCSINGGWGLQPWVYNNQCQDASTVESELQSIVNGYNANSAHNWRVLAIGINNSTAHTSWNWDSVGTGEAKILDNINYPSQTNILLVGDDDFEPQWPGPVNDCLGYVDGWNYQEYNKHMALLVDNGWLDENTSQWDGSTHTPYYPYGWTAADLNKLNWSGEVESNFLEEYDSGWATQLEHLDMYSYYHSVGAWTVLDVLGGGEEGGLDDDTAWQDVINATHDDTHTAQSYIDYLSDQQNVY